MGGSGQRLAGEGRVGECPGRLDGLQGSVIDQGEIDKEPLAHPKPWRPARARSGHTATVQPGQGDFRASPAHSVDCNLIPWRGNNFLINVSALGSRADCLSRRGFECFTVC